MNSPSITCRWCAGKGRRKLSKPLQKVYEVIVKLGQPTCKEIFQKLNGDYKDRTVANQYVKRLVEMNLVRKVGQQQYVDPVTGILVTGEGRGERYEVVT